MVLLMGGVTAIYVAYCIDTGTSFEITKVWVEAWGIGAIIGSMWLFGRTFR
jgi:hypothetical protein